MKTTIGVNDLLQIDYGLVMRCLKLADVLRLRSVECHFIRRMRSVYHFDFIHQRSLCHNSFAGGAGANTQQHVSRQCTVV